MVEGLRKDIPFKCFQTATDVKETKTKAPKIKTSARNRYQKVADPESIVFIFMVVFFFLKPLVQVGSIYNREQALTKCTKNGVA